MNMVLHHLNKVLGDPHELRLFQLILNVFLCTSCIITEMDLDTVLLTLI